MTLAVFAVPIRLESEANQREHWRKRAARVKSHRGAVAMIGRRYVFDGLLAHAPLMVTMTRVAPRVLDDDNATRSCKAVRDELAVLLGVDDRDPRVKWLVAQARGGVREYAVRIHIEGVGDEGAA